MYPLIWTVGSPWRLVIALLLVILEDRHDVAYEVQHALRRRWPWRNRLVSRIDGVPEYVRSVLTFDGLSDDEIAERWRGVGLPRIG